MTKQNNETSELQSAIEHINATNDRIALANNTLVDLSGKESVLRNNLTEPSEKIVRQLKALMEEKVAITMELDLLNKRRQSLLDKITGISRTAQAAHQKAKRRHKQDSMDRATELISSEFGDRLREQLLALAHLQGLGLDVVFKDLFMHRPEGHTEQQEAAESLGEYVEPPEASEALRTAQQIVSDNRYSGYEMPELEVG